MIGQAYNNAALGVLKRMDCTVLKDSYIRVRYQVMNGKL